MTTTTDGIEIRPDTLTFNAIPDDFLHQVRVARLDDAGRRPRSIVDNAGGAPIRCCLRYSEPGEELLLASYGALRHGPRTDAFDPGPYDELGPVFVHANDCLGYQTAERYPSAFTISDQVFRCYGPKGNIVGGRVVAPEEDHDAAAAELLSDPGVTFIHTHNVVYGCFMVEIRRAGGPGYLP